MYEFLFQIETRLENPTKYHVLESQRRQVAEYLSEGSAPETSTSRSPSLVEQRTSPAVSPGDVKGGVARGAGAGTGQRRVSGPFSPNYSSAATSPSEYAPSEVRHTTTLFSNARLISAKLNNNLSSL